MSFSPTPSQVYPFGTHHPPTDHHLMEPWCHVDYDVDKLYFRPISRCLGGRPAHSPLLSYERQFIEGYADVPRLSWTVYLEGHEPSFRAASTLDVDLAAHLIKLRSRHAENTAVLILSDHGIHYGNYYEKAAAGPQARGAVTARTHIYRDLSCETCRAQEHAMPLFYALFPRSILHRHPSLARALTINQHRLISPFDVHATLRHILHYPRPQPPPPVWEGLGVYYTPRPASLLDEARRDIAEISPRCRRDVAEIAA